MRLQIRAPGENETFNQREEIGSGLIGKRVLENTQSDIKESFQFSVTNTGNLMQK